MPDGPYFPKPKAKDAEPYRAPSAPAIETRAPIVVTRAEPPSDPEPRAKAKLTREEMRALIAVEAARRPPWRRSLRRSAILVPTGLVAHGMDLVFGRWALPLGLVVFAAAFVWIARPLFRRDGFT